MKKSILWICLVGLLLAGIPAAVTAATIYELGRNPFAGGPIDSEAQLREMVAAQQADLMTGFQKAGAADLFESFNSQFPDAEITMVQVQPGETLPWMLFKKSNKVRVLKDVTWKGQEPFEAYQFFIDQDGQRYEFVVPVTCGNLGLRDVAPAPPMEQAVAPPPPPPPVNQDPTCVMQAMPTRLFSGQTVTLDAGGSSDPDGSISSVTFTLMDSSGQAVAESTVTQAPFVEQMTIPGKGNYTVKAVVTDDKGTQMSSPECEQSVESLRRGAWLADVAFYRQFDPANYIGGRIGYEYRLDERWSLIGMVGAFPKLDGNQGASAAVVDAFLNLRCPVGFFAGLGVGGWITDGDDDDPIEGDYEDTDLDLILNMGARIWGDPEGFNTSLFVEARSAFDEFDTMAETGRYGFGVRFQF
jgi:hypothetical protein